LKYRSKIHRLMKIAGAGGAVTEKAQNDAIFIANLKCPGDAHRVQRLSSDGNRQWVDRVLPGNRIAALIAHPEQVDVVHRQAMQEGGGVLAIIGNDVIVAFADRLGRTKGGGFLTLVLRECSHSPGTLKLKSELIKLAANDHL